MSKKRKRHTPETIVRKLRDADAMLTSGKSLGEVVQSLAVGEATYHRWRQQFGGMKAEEAKRLKELEVENARLKKPLLSSDVFRRFSGQWTATSSLPVADVDQAV